MSNNKYIYKNNSKAKTIGKGLTTVSSILTSIILTEHFFSNFNGWGKLGLYVILSILYLKLIAVPIIGTILSIVSAGIWIAVIWFLLENIGTLWMKWLLRILFTTAIIGFVFSYRNSVGTNSLFTQFKKANTKNNGSDNSTTSTSNKVYQELIDAIIPQTDYLSNYFTCDYFYLASNESDVIVRVLLTAEHQNGKTVQGYEVSVLSKNSGVLEQIATLDKLILRSKLKNIEDIYNLKACKKFNNYQEAYSYAANSYRKSNKEHEDNSKYTTDDSLSSLFNGCTDKSTLNKRYHQLMKIYHPDSTNGDNEMAQKVQQTYEKLLSNLN